MNILFISNLTGNLWAGPNNSVPEQVRAQSRIDNVFWYNLNYNKRDEWTQNGLNCKNYNDYPSGRLKDLPKPFDYPDIAVVEETYCFPFCRLISDLQRNGIPYVIIPRSTLTSQAQKHKSLKKKIGNIVYFRRMFRKAASIQYLTNQELMDSADGNWNCNAYVLPNGINMPADYLQKEEDTDGFIHITYIGRLEIYQKGLDLLVDACKILRDEFLKNKCLINLFGPNQEGTQEKLEQLLVENHLTDLIRIKGTVVGVEKEKTLKNSHVFIMTSRFEGLPMGMLEALSYSLPCFATRGTNLMDAIQNANAGWVAETTIDGIISSMRIMLEDLKYAERIKEKSTNAKKLADNYSWDYLAEKLHEELDAILKQRN